MSRAEWALLIWSALLLLAAVAAKQFHFSETASSRIGAVEVFLTVLTGIALGLTVSYKRRDTRSRQDQTGEGC